MEHGSIALMFGCIILAACSEENPSLCLQQMRGYSLGMLRLGA